jgi:hypothetical protein
MVWTQLWANTAEGGTNGVPVTVANSGGASGDPVSRATAGDIGTAAGNVFAYSNAWASSGVMSFLQTQGVGSTTRNTAFVTWATPQGDWGFRVGFRLNVLPAASGTLVRTYSDSAFTTSSLEPFCLAPTGKVYTRDAIAGISGAQSAGNLAVNTDYIAVYRYQSSLGQAKLDIYPKGSNTLVATSTVAVATATVAGSMYFGIGTTTAAMSLYWDDWLVGYGGPPPRIDVTNTAPVVSLTNAAQRAIAIGSSLSDLAYTATDTGGTISSFTAAVTVKPGGAATPTLTGSPTGIGTASAALTLTTTFAAAGTYEITATAVDDGGLTGTNKYTIEVAPSVGTNAGIRTIQVGEFQIYGGQPDPAAAVADNDPATGLEGPPSGVNKEIWVQVRALGPTGISVAISGFRNGTGTMTVHAELYKTDKVTKVWETAPDLTYTASNTRQVIPVSSAGLTALSGTLDRVSLWLRLLVTTT